MISIRKTYVGKSVTENNLNITTNEACYIAVRALAYISQSQAEMTGFLNETGVAASDIVRLTHNIDFLEGVLSYILGQESLLMSFCAHEKIEPKTVEISRQHLNLKDQSTKH